MRAGLLILLLAGACTTPSPTPLPTHLGSPVQDTAGMGNGAAVALGRQLFYAPDFSLDGKVSCGSCHLQALAFSDGKPTSPGAHGRPGQRNTPGLFNLLWKRHYLSEGGVDALERQVIVPLLTDFEMAFPPEAMEEILQNNPGWTELSLKAYGKKPDWQVFSHSLAAFLKHLVAADSPYDHYLKGDTNALSPSAKAGMRLFHSTKLGCTNCHQGPLLQGDFFAHNGLMDSSDYGRGLATLNDSDYFRFPIPSLRNVAVTAPYMHNASFQTLEEVLQHYARGGSGHRRQSPLIKPFALTEDETQQLIHFFNSLTDSNFLADPRWAPPAS
jgi:cytochrome c peroxidase